MTKEFCPLKVTNLKPNNIPGLILVILWLSQKSVGLIWFIDMSVEKRSGENSLCKCVPDGIEET